MTAMSARLNPLCNDGVNTRCLDATSFIYPSRQHLAPKLRAFLDFLVEQFGRG